MCEKSNHMTFDKNGQVFNRCDMLSLWVRSITQKDYEYLKKSVSSIRPVDPDQY